MVGSMSNFARLASFIIPWLRTAVPLCTVSPETFTLTDASE